MQSILRKLYHGDIRPDVKTHAKDSPYAKALRKSIEIKDRLVATLDDSERELLEDYCEAHSAVDSIVNFDTFTYALRFGVLLVVEVYTNGGGMTADEEGGDKVD